MTNEFHRTDDDAWIIKGIVTWPYVRVIDHIHENPTTEFARMITTEAFVTPKYLMVPRTKHL